MFQKRAFDFTKNQTINEINEVASLNINNMYIGQFISIEFFLVLNEILSEFNII